MNSNKQAVGCGGLVALPVVLILGLGHAPVPTLILMALIVVVVVWQLFGRRR